MSLVTTLCLACSNLCAFFKRSTASCSSLRCLRSFSSRSSKAFCSSSRALASFLAASCSAWYAFSCSSCHFEIFSCAAAFLANSACDSFFSCSSCFFWSFSFSSCAFLSANFWAFSFCAGVNGANWLLRESAFSTYFPRPNQRIISSHSWIHLSFSLFIAYKTASS